MTTTTTEVSSDDGRRARSRSHGRWRSSVAHEGAFHRVRATVRLHSPYNARHARDEKEGDALRARRRYCYFLNSRRCARGRKQEREGGDNCRETVRSKRTRGARRRDEKTRDEERPPSVTLLARRVLAPRYRRRNFRTLPARRRESIAYIPRGYFSLDGGGETGHDINIVIHRRLIN